jgi:predicted DNA-binding transcriptional regulator AlpA
MSTAAPSGIDADPDQLLDTPAFAKLVCITENAARQMRVNGTGPRFIKLTAHLVRYRVGDILDWFASRPAAHSTSELGQRRD